MIYFRENVWTLNHYFKKIKIKTEIKKVSSFELEQYQFICLEGIPRANRLRPIFTNYASILGHFKSNHKTNILGSYWTATDSELHYSFFRATGGKRKSMILQINVQNVERLTCCIFLQEGYFRSRAQNSRVEPWIVKEILIPLFLAFLTLQCRSLSTFMWYYSNLKPLYKQTFSGVKRVLPFATLDAWISRLLRDAAFSWRPGKLLCGLKTLPILGDFAI